jgi:hypothetical protein
MRATGASRAATGTLTANQDSTLTLTDASACVLVSNASGVEAYIRLNAAVSSLLYDFILAHNQRAWITDIAVATVHVYANANSGVRVVYW